MRPLIKNINNLDLLPKTFFLTYAGKPIISDNVNKSIKSIWNQAGGKGDIGSILIRAVVKTQVHKYGSMLDKDLLAKLLC